MKVRLNIMRLNGIAYPLYSRCGTLIWNVVDYAVQSQAELV